VRTLFQAAFFVFVYFDGLFGRFLGGAAARFRLSGATGYLCLPGYNCSACDWVSVGCPIGMIQFVVSRLRFMPFYVLGALATVGLVVGSMPCGWFCPVGFVQDLVWRLRSRLSTRTYSIPYALRYVKYVFLVVLVIGLPLLFGSSHPWAENPFCDYVCAVGAATVGVPRGIEFGIGALNPDPWTWIRYGLLAMTVVLWWFVRRPICKLFCPVLAIMGLFNRVSLYQLHVDVPRCTGCGECRAVCHMDICVVDDPASPECTRCLKCRDVCPHACVEFRAGRVPSRRVAGEPG